jgi:hypothetical protein
MAAYLCGQPELKFPHGVKKASSCATTAAGRFLLGDLKSELSTHDEDCQCVVLFLLSRKCPPELQQPKQYGPACKLCC